MNNTLNIVFLIVFLGMLIVSSIVMLDTNFEKIFKQGKIGSIRAFFFIVVFLISIFSSCDESIVREPFIVFTII